MKNKIISLIEDALKFKIIDISCMLRRKQQLI